MTRRILACGRLGRWVLVNEAEHPLPPSARRQLESLWPKLEAEPITPEQAEEWFQRMFQPQEAKP